MFIKLANLSKNTSGYWLVFWGKKDHLILVSVHSTTLHLEYTFMNLIMVYFTF